MLVGNAGSAVGEGEAEKEVDVVRQLDEAETGGAKLLAEIRGRLKVLSSPSCPFSVLHPCSYSAV